MRRIALVAFSVLVAVATGSRAQEDAPRGDVAMVATTTLPFHPFGRANVGDWSVSVLHLRERAGQLASVFGSATKVTAKNGTKLTVTTVGFDGKRRDEERVRVHDLADLTVKGSFLEGFAGDGLSEEKVSTETKVALGGREFRGVRVAFHYSACKQSWEQSLFLSPEVPGFVALHAEEMALGKKGSVSDMELAGFGTREKVIFGSSIEDVEKRLAKN